MNKKKITSNPKLNNLTKILIVGWVISVLFLLYIKKSNKSDIKDIYEKIEQSKRKDIIKDSIFTDSLIRDRDEKLIIIEKELKQLNFRQQEALKKINKKYEIKVNYIYTANPDTNRSIFGRNFSKKIN